MSKKHFVELAEIVKGLKGKADEPTRREVAESLATVCARASRTFDWHRFIAACELEPERPHPHKLEWPEERHVNDPSRWRR